MDELLHQLFFELEDSAVEAHKANDHETLKKIHGFAEWCLHQGHDVWRDAGIGFYENLFSRVPWEQIVPWLSPFAVDQILKTWAVLEREGTFKSLVSERKQFDYRTHVFSTGEIDKL